METLSDIIQRKTNKIVDFEELTPYEKEDILRYIKRKKPNVRVFNKRGFDVLNNKFFVYEYILEEDNAKQIKLEFDSFDIFYDEIQGDVYNKACYYGYTFSDDEIKNHNLIINEINFDSFIDEDISKNSYEFLKELKQQETNEKIKIGNKIKDLVKNINKINSYEELLSALDCFKKEYAFMQKERIFFSLLIQNNRDKIKEILLKFANAYDSSDWIYYGISIDDILYYYGVEDAQRIIDNYKGGAYSEHTMKRHLRRMNNLLDLFCANESTIKKKPGFDSESQLFFVNILFYAKGDERPFMEVRKYFTLFDEFANEMNGDLRGCDLSETTLKKQEISKYLIDDTTKFPTSETYSDYRIRKEYSNGLFHIEQEWLDNNIVVLSLKRDFEFFCDFVHYLKRDLSNADLLMCENIVNIARLKDLNLEGIKLRSSVAKQLGIKLNLISKQKFQIKEFNEAVVNENETKTALMFERQQNDEYSTGISYVTDIHLLHRYKIWKCETIEDKDYVNQVIANEISSDENKIQLLGGDIASDYSVYQDFILKIKKTTINKYFFVTLGNHELWPFIGKKLDNIIETYRDLLHNNGLRLVHNNIYYFGDFSMYDGSIKEITTKELESIDEKELRIKLKSAQLIIFGGLGFAGRNQEFNANQGIYRGVLNREQEIKESNVFEKLYKKIGNTLYDKNVIVFTHMPIKDWSSDKELIKGFVYVNGHSHRNYYFDDGFNRVYADNQIGYKQKEVHMKHLSINMGYDWFSDYKDGIYEINRDDYDKFYRGIGEGITFNRQFQHLYMLKREKTYMFLIQNPKGNLLLLNGGAIKGVNGHSIEYFYENLVRYAQSIKQFLVQYNEYQKKIAQEIKDIGGSGLIHGSIIDIDFFNHLFINPLDGTITPYFAWSMIDKYVYSNIPSLLKKHCKDLYLNFKQKYLTSKNGGMLAQLNSNLKITDKAIMVESTEMYRISRILKGLQFTIKYNIVRLWNDSFIEGDSKENGRLIVKGIIYPEEMDNKRHSLIEQKKKDNS